MVYKIRLRNSKYSYNNLRVVEIFPFDDKRAFCFTIAELLEVLKLWIIGEEEKYPQEGGFKGRWMLYELILKLFNTKDLKEHEEQQNEL